MVSSGLLSGSGLNSQYLNALLVCPPFHGAGILQQHSWTKFWVALRGMESSSLWSAAVGCTQYVSNTFRSIFNAGTATARPRQFQTEYLHCNILPPVKMQDFAPALLWAYKHCYRMIHEGGNFFSRHRGFESCRYDMNIYHMS